jgi:hypothetical protein
VSATALFTLCLVLCSISDLNGNVLVVNNREIWPSYFYEAAKIEYDNVENKDRARRYASSLS